MMDRWRVAIHEAGHAVTAALLQLPIDHTTIVANGDVAGLTQLAENYSPILRAALEDQLPSDVSFAILKISTQYAHGGSVAERLVFETCDAVWWEQDYESIVDLALKASTDPDAFCEDMRRRTQDLLRENMCLVEAVARALMAKDRLSGAEVRELISAPKTVRES